MKRTGSAPVRPAAIRSTPHATARAETFRSGMQRCTSTESAVTSYQHATAQCLSKSAREHNCTRCYCSTRAAMPQYACYGVRCRWPCPGCCLRQRMGLLFAADIIANARAICNMVQVVSPSSPAVLLLLCFSVAKTESELSHCYHNEMHLGFLGSLDRIPLNAELSYRGTSALF